MICYFAFVSLACLSKNASGLWLAFIECYGLLNTLHYFTQIKKNCHDNFSSITRIFSHIFSFFFTFLFTLAKFYINSFHVTIRYYNSYGNLVYLGLARIIVAQGGTGSLFFKDAG